MSQEQYIGKTLKEVRELFGGTVRVSKAGNVPFFGTADYRPNRMNVVLSADGLKFKKVQVVIGEENFELEEVDGSMDNGVVLSYSFG